MFAHCSFFAHCKRFSRASKLDGEDEQRMSGVVQIDQRSIQSLLTNAIKEFSVKLTETADGRLQTLGRQIIHLHMSEFATQFTNRSV